MDNEIPGFADPSNQNDTGKKQGSKEKGKKSGGFQSMGLSLPVLRGIQKRGYKIPTPIQRKTIPLVLEGHDVVAMARTGSGKTACFLIPLFERLKNRTARTGARALILSPTRELALQTGKFIRELGQFTDLKSTVVVGGDSMDDQFSALHGNPDVLIATPGRFLHLCVEMELKLHSIEYIVFDEADRLYEMGFGEQLTEIVHRLPDSRQTLLFSATLPKVLVEFAKAGLTDPVLVRLDVETKLPEQLQLRFISCRPNERVGALLLLLKQILNEEKRGKQVVLFAATKHHVEYLHMILDNAGITNTYIYSNLDPSARKIHAAKFTNRRASVLIVTDVAARGLDIPQLDIVINFHFPGKPKLFVHRVGRCARAGRSGIAYSLVSTDEYACLLDLHLFLGRPLDIMQQAVTGKCNLEAVGRMPQESLEQQVGILLNWHENRPDLQSMLRVCDNAYKQYIRSRPLASTDSNRRVKQLPFQSAAIHPMFIDDNNQATSSTGDSIDRELLINQMKQYRPQGTIFEICSKNKSNDYIAMKTKRALHKDHILSHHRKLEQLATESEILNQRNDDDANTKIDLPSSQPEDIASTFQRVILPKKRKLDDLYKQKKKKLKQTTVKDQEHYIPYSAPDQHTEEGLAVNSFQRDAMHVQLDLTGDSEEAQKISNRMKRWDRKKKKMVSVQSDKKSQKKILTESGVWIPATFKGGRYAEWKEKTKATETQEEEDDDDNDDGVDNSNRNNNKRRNVMNNTHWGRHNRNVHEKKRRSELKTTEQILKARKIAAKKKQRNGRKKSRNKKK